MRSVRYTLYLSLAIIFLIGLVYSGKGMISILQEQVYEPDVQPGYKFIPANPEECKYHNKIRFEVNDFDYDERFLDIDVEIRLTNNSKLYRYRDIYGDDLDRRPFYLRLSRYNEEYYWYSFKKEDNLTYHFSEKLPLRYPTYNFPFEGKYVGEIEINDYGIGHTEPPYKSKECFDYSYVKNVKDPDIMVHFYPGDKFRSTSFFIVIERKNDPYKARMILALFSLILICIISVYLLFIKDRTTEGVVSIIMSLFILQSFKPQQIKSVTIYDDVLLVSFVMGLIIVISSFFKCQIKDEIDKFATSLVDLRNYIKEFIVKLTTKRGKG